MATANAVMQVLFVLASMGLYSAIQRQYARDGGRQAATKLLTLSIVAAVLVTVLADATGPLWSPYVGFPTYSGAVRLGVWWAGVSAVTNSALALLRSQDRLLAFSAVNLLQSVVAEVTSLLLLVFVAPTALMFVLGQLGAQVVATGLALALVPPAGVRRVDRRLLTSALAYGIPLIPAVLSTFVLNSADRLIVSGQLGAAAVARYQVAYNIGALPMMLVGILATSWMPRIFAFDVREERGAVLAAGRDMLLRLLVPVVIGLSVGAPLVLHIWAPAEYDPDDLLLVTALVIVSVLPYAVGLTLTRALMAEDRTGFIAAAQGVGAVANVMLNLALIPRFGLEGSAAATLAAYVILQRLLLLRARELVPTGPPVRLLLAVTAAAAIAVGVAAAPASGRALVVRAVLAAAALVWFFQVALSARRGSPDGPRRRDPHTQDTERRQRRSDPADDVAEAPRAARLRPRTALQYGDRADQKTALPHDQATWRPRVIPDTTLPLLTTAFDALDETGVPWVVLRGDENTVARGGDVDLLVAPGALAEAAAGLGGAGFVPVPSAGEDPHAFFLGCDDGPTWVRLDVVDLLTAGDSLLPSSLAGQVLARRIRAHDRWVLDPDDEFWLRLLHHAAGRGGRGGDLEECRRRAGSAEARGPVAVLVAELSAAGTSAAQVLTAVRRDPGPILEQLGRSLRVPASGSGVRPLGVGRRMRRAVARAAQAVHAARRPPGVSVAILGPDGAGKTTLAEGLRGTLPLPTRYVYLGVWREYGWDRWLRHVVGARLLLRLLRLSWRSWEVWWHRRRGRVVLLDRFTYDALLPSDELDRRGRISVAMVRRLGTEPDLVLVLDASPEVMFARKGEQGIEELERRRQTYLDVTSGHPACVVIDAERPALDVLAGAERAVWSELERRWKRPVGAVR